MDLFNAGLIQFFVSLMTDNVRLDFFRVSVHNVVKAFTNTGYIFGGLLSTAEGSVLHQLVLATVKSTKKKFSRYLLRQNLEPGRRSRTAL